MTLTKRAVGSVLAGAFIIASCGGSDAADPVQDASEAVESDQDAAPAGNPLLTGTVPTVTGSQVDLAGFEGKDVLLWVWAPW
ncbi:MAG: hypothetical protein AB8G14_14080 [Ilumatobacter sp.]